MKSPKFATPADASLRQVNEADRLETLQSYQVLDTGPEQVFNDIAQLAAFICGTPISLVSLIDGDRQWFKARVGLNVQETPREHAFCQYAMRANNVYEVRDATVDERFANNPLVTGDPNIRFYAGAPLLSPEGLPLGTLCAIDTIPRELSTDQRDALRILARQVMAHLELRRIRVQLEDERQKLDGVLRMANSTGDSLYASARAEIFVKQEQRLVRVPTADLQYIEALGDYVNLHTTRERLTMYGTMKDLETKLPVRDFARVHRKYIVRLDRIVAIEGDVALLDGVRDAHVSRTTVRVPIGSSYKAGLLGRLNLV
ncbi:GAF domain-containing DNA-binding protein [Hymenobacter convexus]|uniref:GAF domain-containing DNA-binding protein n=1 Tax=Hymenobacter sp. CA1UV-4 TaxID=3063782 RepID=UPI002713CFB9|nr:GAF domain-containing DNA-binding protein [Hymenobacter sp. CA1UV-4]MDO7850686.1 GAF domain-containing DNA-binding protein [Hymenobacter sp. CA1UV-4]